MKQNKKEILPLAVVLASLSIIEIAMTVLYPYLNEPWEKIPVLLVILSIPVSIVATFIFLWVRKPAHLYPPSVFKAQQSTQDLFLTLYAYNSRDCLGSFRNLVFDQLAANEGQRDPQTSVAKRNGTSEDSRKKL